MKDPEEEPDLPLPVDQPHVHVDGTIGHADAVVPNPAAWLLMIEFAAATAAWPSDLAPDDIEEMIDQSAPHARRAYREGMTNQQWVDATTALIVEKGE